MMGDITLAALRAALPELYLTIMSAFLLMVAAYKCKRVCNAMLAGTLFSLFGTAWFLLPQLGTPGVNFFNGMFAAGGFSAFAKLLILLAAAMAVIIAGDWLKEAEAKPSEFLVLILFATLGMLFMVSANDLLSLYLGLEMSSLSLYVLAAFERDDARSSEAGLKYFVLGALASGMLLFGISLVYGFTGTTSFTPLAKLFGAHAVLSKGVIVGMVMIIVAFCFKVSAVPFHMWTPDVYEGAPTPVTAFFASASKAAAILLMARVLVVPFGQLITQWQQVIVFVSAASMAVGALGALMQTNIKRLLAYSSIAHAGFMLMGLAAGTAAGVQALLIYVGVYIFMSVGAFGCVLMMRRQGEYVENIRDLAGLARSRPLFAFTLAALMFSMAGIPPLAGFFGKLYVVVAAVAAGLAPLAVFGMVTSVIGAYYYLRVVKIMYLDDPIAQFDTHLPPLLKTGIIAGAVVTLAFFLVPTPLVAQAKIAAEVLLH